MQKNFYNKNYQDSSTMEKNDKHIKDCLNNLPQVDVDADIMWRDIEFHLDFEEHTTEQLNQLPEVDIDSNGLWSALEKELGDQKSEKERRLIPSWSYFSAIAATVVLLIIFLWNKSESTTNTELKYSFELINVSTIDPPVISELEDQAITFINNSCKMQLEVCSTAEFIALKIQLDELNLEIEKLNKEFAINNDPYIMKAHVKVENIRAEVTKKLINILVS